MRRSLDPRRALIPSPQGPVPERRATTARARVENGERRWLTRTGLGLLILLVHTIPPQAATPEQPAQRIVSLAPHITELVFAAGAGEQLVGAVAYSDYPPQARQIPRVGSYQATDLEAILALRPDLIIAWTSGNREQLLQRLDKLDLRVEVSDPSTLPEIARDLERIGRWAGTEATAEQAAASFRRRLDQLRQAYANRPPVRVFYQLWHRPLMTVGGNQLITRVIRLCGGRNVFAELKPLAPKVSREAVIAARPAVIITGTGADSASNAAGLELWSEWSTIPAVANGQLHIIQADRLQRHTPRILDGAERLCQLLETARQQPGTPSDAE